MRPYPNALILGLAIFLALIAPGKVLAEGVGRVAQVGFGNVAYAYQEVLSEVVILQLAQIGNENETRVLQDGHRDSVFVIQFGFANQANINQIKTLAWTNASDNDAFAYQSGSHNMINLLQLGDDNTASLYQIDTKLLVGTGKNGVLIMQFDMVNIAHGIQLGAGQMTSALQNGNDNMAQFGQIGSGNLALLSQNGNHNTIALTQETRGIPFAPKRRVNL